MKSIRTRSNVVRCPTCQATVDETPPWSVQELSQGWIFLGALQTGAHF